MDLVTLVLACSLYADNSIPYAMIQTGTQNNPLVVTVDDDTKTFKTIPAAVKYTHTQIALGKNLEIGLMQIPNRWLPEIGAHASDLFRPCKNLVVATQILEKLRFKCQSIVANNPTIDIQSCVLSLYKRKNLQNGLTYASQVIEYAKIHPFNELAEKARDPGMLDAIENPNTYKPQRSKQILTENNHSEDYSS
jgi:Transglycosylase SLT domain